MDLKAIGRRIADAREKKKLSTVKLGELVRRTDQTILNWEAGKVAPALSIMGILASALGETEEYLLFRIRRGEQLHAERRFLEYINESEHELLTAFRQCDDKLHRLIIDHAKGVAIASPAADAEILNIKRRRRKK